VQLAKAPHEPLDLRRRERRVEPAHGNRALEGREALGQFDQADAAGPLAGDRVDQIAARGGFEEQREIVAGGPHDQPHMRPGAAENPLDAGAGEALAGEQHDVAGPQLARDLLEAGRRHGSPRRRRPARIR
jgi:hypothetical protein